MTRQMLLESRDSLFTVEYAKRSSSYQMQTDHYHSFYEMYILLAGKRRYFIRDRSYVIEQGDLVLINKRDFHKTTGEGGSSPHERIVIYFYESFLRQLYKADADFLLAPFKSGHPVCRLPLKERRQAEQLSATILHELRTQAPGCELAARQAFIDLLLLAARHAGRSDADMQEADKPVYRKMSDVAKFINAHYAEPLTLELLAGHFHMSPYYLSRSFKQATGLPLTEFINIARVKAAEQLLKESGMSILEVGAAVGYNNFSHFGKMFKKLTNVSPREYRKR
ncbi:AraC family transcriptional regulator [Paenibacillus humicola]|uniref:AraC family transcriptional regulator n=1 Tax=Paenibacillus humicola TaxID=3110540 RepID=UPI00237AC4AC|nr:helix-turn-helix domain-containing protein [Paenibacillus humicola]